MIPVKIQCACGQRYAFDVEPLDGRMPSAVACPACGADGTAAANAIIAQSVSAQPVVAAAASAPGPRLRGAPAVPATQGVPPAPMPVVPRSAATPEREWGPGGEGDTWKWWYYILAGICIAGYDIWRAYDTQRLKPLGGLFLSVILIAIGIWDFQRKRKARIGK